MEIINLYDPERDRLAKYFVAKSVGVGKKVSESYRNHTLRNIFVEKSV